MWRREVNPEPEGQAPSVARKIIVPLLINIGGEDFFSRYAFIPHSLIQSASPFQSAIPISFFTPGFPKFYPHKWLYTCYPRWLPLRI